MPLQLPNLDDRTYNDLVQEALSLIPTSAEEWTNYNPSDPGITLIEMFAYLTEMLIYRLNQVTDANKEAFLKLVRGPDWTPKKSLNEEIRDAVLALRQSERAVTCEDFENLTLAVNGQLKPEQQKVARAHCLPKRNLVSENPSNPEERPGHISVVIVPDSNLQPNDELVEVVTNYLEPYRLLTTRVHVVGPRYVSVGVRLTLHLKRDVRKQDIVGSSDPDHNPIEALKRFFDPLKGGSEKKGWPFGRNVFISEIYELLDGLSVVDYVEQTDNSDELITDIPKRRIPDDVTKPLIAIKVQPEELVMLNESATTIIIQSPIEN